MINALYALYWGGLGSVSTLFLAKTDMEHTLPVAGGTGISSILLLLWAVKILRQERDAIQKKLEQERLRAQSAELNAELKCLDCNYFRYGRLLSLVLQPELEKSK